MSMYCPYGSSASGGLPYVFSKQLAYVLTVCFKGGDSEVECSFKVQNLMSYLIPKESNQGPDMMGFTLECRRYVEESFLPLCHKISARDDTFATSDLYKVCTGFLQKFTESTRYADPIYAANAHGVLALCEEYESIIPTLDRLRKRLELLDQVQVVPIESATTATADSYVSPALLH